MVNGEVDFARFPVTLDLDASEDTVPQVGLAATVLFTTTQFPVLEAKVLPMTGDSGKSRAVVLVLGRSVS